MWLSKKESEQILNHLKEQLDYIKECHHRELMLMKAIQRIATEWEKPYIR